MDAHLGVGRAVVVGVGALAVHRDANARQELAVLVEVLLGAGVGVDERGQSLADRAAGEVDGDRLLAGRAPERAIDGDAHTRHRDGGTKSVVASRTGSTRESPAGAPKTMTCRSDN